MLGTKDSSRDWDCGRCVRNGGVSKSSSDLRHLRLSDLNEAGGVSLTLPTQTSHQMSSNQEILQEEFEDRSRIKELFSRMNLLISNSENLKPLLIEKKCKSPRESVRETIILHARAATTKERHSRESSILCE